MEYDSRRLRLMQDMGAANIAAALIMGADNQFYLTGFKALIYSRPIGIMLMPDRQTLIVPGLEEAHAKHDTREMEILVYYEHPEKAATGLSFQDHLREVLADLPSGSRIGVEAGIFSLSLQAVFEEFKLVTVDIGSRLAAMRAIKSAAEINAMKEAARLVDLAVAESLAVLKPGVSEMEMDQAGNKAFLLEVSCNYPNATVAFDVMSPSGVQRTVMPHVFSNTRRINMGEGIIHSRQVALNGYRAECERTVFLGRPTPQQQKLFAVMLSAQQAAMEALRPGIQAREVDWAARRVIQEAGFGEYAIHRTGHSIGISPHEEPYIRFDSEVTIEPGMVYSIEPGIYIPGVGGFRHSDTLVVTPGGADIITCYPRDLESLCL